MKSIFFTTLLITFLILSYEASGQNFKISHVMAQFFSIDRYANEVYYREFAGPNIYIRNLADWSVRTCPFPSLPAFANTSHKCVYGDGDSLFIYDFDDNSKFLVYDSVYHYVQYDYAFSPDDMYLLFYNHYFSFADSSVHYMNFDPNDLFEFDWTNETKVIYVYDEYYMSLYDYVTDIRDTLFISPPNVPIIAFAFNLTDELLYYSLYEPDHPKIHSYDISTRIDSIVYDTENDSDNICWSSPNWFRSMKWSPQVNRMAFFSFELEGYNGIYTFNPDSGSLRSFTENCGILGYDYDLKWINEDTIAFYCANDNSIYGFALNYPVSINESPDRNISDEFSVTSYPNPFNGSVKINIEGKIDYPEIRIYSINGEEIKRFECIEGTGYRFQQVWNGTNNSGDNVSSGIYFVIITDKTYPETIKGTSKIIYLK